VIDECDSYIHYVLYNLKTSCSLLCQAIDSSGPDGRQLPCFLQDSDLRVSSRLVHSSCPYYITEYVLEWNASGELRPGLGNVEYFGRWATGFWGYCYKSSTAPTTLGKM
jgi:hypothetical protein